MCTYEIFLSVSNAQGKIKLPNWWRFVETNVRFYAWFNLRSLTDKTGEHTGMCISHSIAYTHFITIDFSIPVYSAAV